MMINKEDIYFFHEGRLFDSYKHFGCHVVKDNNQIIGAEFMVYAPNAKYIFIPGDFNYWLGGTHKMEKIDECGIFYLYIPHVREWDKYKYEIHTYQGEILFKSDPYGYYADMRPRTDSKVVDLDGYCWHDLKFRQHKKSPYENKMLIYEMHLGSWMNYYGKVDYNKIIDNLIPYLKEYGYTHVELMPIYEYPCDDSWGYQGTGYFSVTSRYGSPKDFMYFIDRLHEANIYVILDWVPGHTCKDSHGLYRFDGSHLYEYADEFKRENVVWGTVNMDFSKGSVRSFFISNALFWMNYYHVDGFRVDAVSNLIYYLGNSENKENFDAINFLRELSTKIFEVDNNILLMAEDSTSYPKVTHPVSCGGIGFNYKWNMGWMHDTLEYFSKDPIYRKYHHNDITFSMTYAFSENFVLPFSHDEVVHLKKSLLDKMPGDYWQKFANFRLLLGYMITFPGKKLLFMGAEFGQFSEWNFKKELDWNLLDYPMHKNLKKYVIDLFHIYGKEKALYELDHNPEGFKWIEANNQSQSIFIYARKAKRAKDEIIVILNCTPNSYLNYRIGVSKSGEYEEILNSDLSIYGGSNLYNGQKIMTEKISMHNLPYSVNLTISPLSITLLKKKSVTKSLN